MSNHPASPSSLNLRAIATLAAAFPQATIGYSDHAIGLDAASFAAVAGARIIEKHFTLDKAFSDFRDHSLSADPTDLRNLRNRLNDVESYLGTGLKGPDESEVAIVPLIRRSLTFVRDKAAGSVVTESDLQFMRPAGGLPPVAFIETVGRRLKVEKKAGDVVFDSDLG